MASALHVLAAVAAPAAAPARVASPPRGQRTTEEQRWSVVSMHKDDRSNTYIARKLIMTIARNTVRDIIARYNSTGSPMSGWRSGRPRATTEEEDTQIALSSRMQPFSPPRAIRHALDLDVSPRTIDRRLQEA
jgi:transposase